MVYMRAASGLEVNRDQLGEALSHWQQLQSERRTASVSCRECGCWRAYNCPAIPDLGEATPIGKNVSAGTGYARRWVNPRSEWCGRLLARCRSMRHCLSSPDGVAAVVH